jgi:imidazolonepropionase
MLADLLWRNINLATMRPGGVPYGAIENAAIAVRGGRIVWLGEQASLPPELRAARVEDGNGLWVTPSLIDCHTHIVFGGNRAGEFEARLAGVTYEDAARRGGGILSTVQVTRAASEAELVEAALPRLRCLMADGVRLVEIKSGYGLTLDDEIKMLRAARALGARAGIGVRTTFLGAHAVPPEFAGRAGDYVEHIVRDMLPAVRASGLADAVDAFAESIAFSQDEVSRIFEAARALGLRVKLHADQLTDGGGAGLAARHGALSADHLEYAAEEGVRAMAQSGTIAVLLPGAYATVGAKSPPPVAAFRRHGVGMAVATDCNPGSSPLCSLLMAMNLACALFRMTPEEVLAGVTREAAKALGLGAQRGILGTGFDASLAFWDVGHPRELAYWMGGLRPVSMYPA